MRSCFCAGGFFKAGKHRSPEKFRGGSPAAMLARFGRPPGDMLGGPVLLRLPGPLGSDAWACSTGLGVLASCNVIARNELRKKSVSLNNKGPTRLLL